MKIFQLILLLALHYSLLMAVPQTTGLSVCSDSSSALSPAPLQEEWAIEWWMPRHEAKLTEEGRESSQLLFIGDSITHGWETTGKNVAEKYFADYSIYNIGYSGDRTENVLWRFERGEIDGINPELAVVMIGTNNTGHRQDPPECTAKGIEMIVGELKEKLPETKILLLAIFPRGETPVHELRQLNHQINDRIDMFDEDNRVYFLDINEVFLDDEGNLREEIMPDMLHPNEYGYRLWAEAMNSTLKRLLEL